MAAELINLATSDKLKEMDWMKNIEICEIVSRDPGQAKDVVKAIKKRLGHKSSNTQLFAVLLLEMLMNNCGEHIHKQVIDTGILPILVKIVKKKTDLPVREKIFLLLDAMQTSHGGASGQFPQYYAAYYELVSAGVKFTHAPRLLPSDIPTSEGHENNRPNHRPVSSKQEGVAKQSDAETIPESSIIQKAASTLEVLREVLDAVDSQHCEGAKDEFTLDLVEQCTFQKQRVMHLVLTSQDEKVVSRAIELNEQMHKLLSRHDALLSSSDTSLATHLVHEAIEEEDDDEGLFRRIRKGKACMRPEEEEHMKQPAGAIHESVQAERLHRPLIRPLCLESQESSPPPPPLGATVIIPPPPAKHIEREKFFQEKRVDGQTLSGHMRGLSLHSRNASSSYSESVDSNE